ncbi:MAG: helix-turn-helix transcriptional regulator, partial [Pseudomonadota bacterium]
RLRLRRKLLGMRQRDVAELIGLSYQQIQKYESGKSRISASTLHCLGLQLGVPVGYFFKSK